jgi:acetyl-CoA acetyltransferase
MSLSDKTAIAGVGWTEFSHNSGRSELRLTLEAITAALADAGLSPKDVDGLCTFTLDNNAEIEVFANLGGKDLKFFSRIDYGGGGACAPLQQAAMAVASGIAEVVVCYRGMNERSEYRFGAGAVTSGTTPVRSWVNLHAMQGLRTPAASLALIMRRYMHEYGATEEDFGRVAVSARRHAATNPAARFYEKPITLDDYMVCKMIADPFRLYDCCQESDGAVAIVVVSAERARDLKKTPVLIRAAAQGASDHQRNMNAYYERDISQAAESKLVSEQLYRQAGLTPADMDAAIIYDHFGPTVLMSLEAYGFCGRGEAKDFIRNGAIEVGGRLPVNTNGGQVGEAYIHGMNGIAEAVRQLRGEAANQVEGAKHVLATAGLGVPTSAVILGVV